MRIRSSRSNSVVVLNASFEPMGVITLHRALVFLIHERATIVEAIPGEPVLAAGGSLLERPRVIAFREMVRTPSVYRPVAWTKRGMLARDGNRCGYCRKPGNTVDHVLPRSKGGQNAWLNTITACSACNSKKADRTPAEAGMPLLITPREVSRRDTLMISIAELGADLEALGLAGAVPAAVPAPAI